MFRIASRSRSLASSWLTRYRTMSAGVAHQLHLTETEDRFINLLDEFAKTGRKEVQEPAVGEVECRIAGGWVRDKLLSLPSSDVDVTLSSTAGYPFAVAFTQWLQTRDPPIPIRSIGKVAANPDQSKHLETATTKILGLDLDFVALRSESYADGSRIPSEVRLGTPEEDALRRDITINTLFYNVHSRQVEDWTGKGLSDLAQRLIRTPLEPIKTFQDDPLRILRCIRFASRYDYKLVPELEAALQDEGILEALRTRISRERVGIELEKMLKHANAFQSIELMVRTGLYPHIFVMPPPVGCPAVTPWTDALRAAELLRSLLPGGSRHEQVHPALISSSHDNDTLKRLWLACCMVPFRGGVSKDKKKDVPTADIIIRDGIKLGNHDRDAVSKLFTAATKLSKPSSEGTRASIGLALRDPAINDPTTGTSWSTSTLFSLVLDLLDGHDAIPQYNAFVDHVIALDLPRLIEEKPRLDGNEINALLSLKPSILTKTLIERVVEWQLENPSASKDDCRQWLLRQQAEGCLPSAPERAPAPKKPRKE